ncbi:alpha/beta-hydrolase [Xylaria sp. FL1042]|nr:alpha/beta-hydrolase [Xylaria sp. FL1042]
MHLRTRGLVLAITAYISYIPVKITSDNLVFNITEWQDDYALQGFLTTVTTCASAHYPGIRDGTTVTETKTYDIAASFCRPKTSPGLDSVILATHGVGLARAHWNSPFKPEEYNFVQHAVSKGYSVFFYDRLGNGRSNKYPSGYKNQFRMQREVLKELATLVRPGRYTGNCGTPKKVVAMGFALGAYISHYTMASHPELFDAAVLTGVNYNTSIASLQNTDRFSEYDTGYLTWVDAIANINTYFKYPYYDVDVALSLEEMKNPFTFLEFETPVDGDLDASNFTGPVLAMAGKNDYVICDGECKGIFDEAAREVFKNAKRCMPYLHPHSNHNLNFHHNATGAFNIMTDSSTLISNQQCFCVVEVRAYGNVLC